MKKIKDLQPSLIEYTDGTKDHFNDFLRNLCAANENEILEKHYRNVLRDGLQASDDEDYEVENVVIPIISEIILFAFYNNKDEYTKIIQSFIEKHEKYSG